MLTAPYYLLYCPTPKRSNHSYLIETRWRNRKEALTICWAATIRRFFLLSRWFPPAFPPRGSSARSKENAVEVLPDD